LSAGGRGKAEEEAAAVGVEKDDFNGEVIK
jgi:hypothetical protein